MFYKLLEYRNVRVINVFHCSHERDGLFSPKRASGHRPLLELALVSLLKFVEAMFRIGMEPLSEGRGRGEVFEPEINTRIFLFHAPRPQTIDKDARAVARRGCVIRSLHLYRHTYWYSTSHTQIKKNPVFNAGFLGDVSRRIPRHQMHAAHLPEFHLYGRG